MLSTWKPYGLMSESASTDFHELRQGFSPPKQSWKINREGRKVRQEKTKDFLCVLACTCTQVQAQRAWR